MGAGSKAVKGLAEALEAAGKGASKVEPALKVVPKAEKARAALTAVEHAPTDAATFAKIIESVRANPNPLYSANITPYTVDEYAKMKTYISPDGKSGYAIKDDGELVSVFSLEKGRGRSIVFDAVANKGAQKLDAFDINNKLPSLYGEFMDETDRLKFSREHAPKDWDYEKLGEPDVTFMKTNPEKVKKSLAAALEERLPEGLLDEELIKRREAMSPDERAAYYRNLDQLFENTRSKAQGFGDKTYFHGTGKADIKEFAPTKRGIFFAPNPDTANDYARFSSGRGEGHGEAVFPVKLRQGNSFNFKNADQVADLERNLDVKDSGDLADKISYGIDGENWQYLEMPEVQDAIKKSGYDSYKVSESGRINTAVYDPANIRSVNAAFDPRYKKSKYILAADGQANPDFGLKMGPTQAELAAQKLMSAAQKYKQDQDLEGARNYVRQAQDEEEPSALEKAGNALGAPQRKLVSEPLAKLAGAQPTGDAEQDFANVVQGLADKANLPQDSITNAGKALAVGALSLGADPLNAVAAPFKGVAAAAKAVPKGLEKLQQVLRGGSKAVEGLTNATKAVTVEPKVAEAALKLRKAGKEMGGGKVVQELSTGEDLIKANQAPGPALPQPKNVEHIRYKNELTQKIFEDMEEFVKRHPNATQEELRQAVRAFEANHVQTLGPVPKKKD